MCAILATRNTTTGTIEFLCAFLYGRASWCRHTVVPEAGLGDTSFQGEARGGMTTLFGAWANLGDYDTIPSLLERFDVSDNMWTAVIAHLGDPGNNIALFSALPATAVVAACGMAQTDQGPLSPLQATQVGLVWRMSRRIVAFRSGVLEADFADVDLWAVQQEKEKPEVPVKNPQGTSGLKEAVLKMSTIIDQCDESELLPPDEVKINQWIHAYISVMGAAPEESEEHRSSVGSFT